MLPSMRWHFFRTAPASGTFNMALDEAMMRMSRRTGDAYFRLYGWESPTLSLGRNQRARGHYDSDAARSLGVGFVRRPTGGRALMHHREITYSAALPARSPADASAAYAFINEVLLEGLREMGVGASRSSGSGHQPPGLRPCFDAPSAHEIVLRDRKLIGSAQWRHSDTLLQHGSILVRDDQAMIPRLMREPLAAPPVAASLHDALGWDPTMDDAAPPMRAALEKAVGGGVAEFDAELTRDDVAGLQRVYADEAWTWRR
jgi:lipoate-protein ligase A